MAYNNYAPFWDFVRTFDRDHPSPLESQGSLPNAYGGFPFGGSPMFPSHHHGFGPGDRRGRRQPDGAQPENDGRPHRGPRGFGHRGRAGHHGTSHEHSGPPPPFGFPSGFDVNAFMDSLSAHPLAQAFRTFAEQAAAETREDPDSEDAGLESGFTPPVDIFSMEKQYILHVAIPGAKKEDVGVHWDPEKSVLNLAGVVYRHGDEEFLKSLSKSERRVGVFERSIMLPGSNEEKVDGDAITAKLEDGVLVVTIPKAEKEWTEVKRVDIE